MRSASPDPERVDPYRVPNADLVEPEAPAAPSTEEQAERSDPLLRGIALAMSLLALVTANPLSGGGLVRLAATAGLALAIARGSWIARKIAVVLYGLGGLLCLLSAVPLGTHQHDALFGLGCAYALIALVLACPAQVRAYLSRST